MSNKSMVDDKKNPQSKQDRPSYEDLAAKHQALETELARRDAEEARQVQSGGQPVGRVPRVDKNSPQYRFEVSGSGPAGAHLPKRTITCGSEDEAKRIYCLETPDTAEGKSGRAVSPTEYRFTIVNLDEGKRKAAVRNKQRYAELSRKYSVGVTLTDQEKQELTKLEPQHSPEARREAALAV